MKQNQPICIELLNSFTDVELENFQHFINCPYFNTDKSIISLFEALKKYILHKKNFDLEAQNTIFRKIFNLSNNASTLNYKQKKHLNAKLSLLKKFWKAYKNKWIEVSKSKKRPSFFSRKENIGSL